MTSSAADTGGAGGEASHKALEAMCERVGRARHEDTRSLGKTNCLDPHLRSAAALELHTPMELVDLQHIDVICAA